MGASGTGVEQRGLKEMGKRVCRRGCMTGNVVDCC